METTPENFGGHPITTRIIRAWDRTAADQGHESRPRKLPTDDPGPCRRSKRLASMAAHQVNSGFSHIGPQLQGFKSMTVVSVEHALAGKMPAGGEVTVRGWVRTRRDSKAGLSFVNVSDGSCFAPIQVVAPSDLPNYESEVKRLTAGCAVIATGTLVASQGQGQSFEIQASAIEVVGWVEDPETYPIQPKAHSLEFLRENAHLRPRTNLFGAVTRIRDCLAKAAHRYFHENGYYWVNTPVITTSDAEGAGQMFRVSTLDLANLPRGKDGTVDFDRDFFGKETFLTVSGQLNVEAFCLSMSKVYTFGPTFRAENSNTTRHLAE